MIGDWTVEPRLQALLSRDEAAAEAGREERRVGHKVMLVLLALAARPGKVLTKEELVDAAWEDGSFPSDEALSTVVYELRKALGDSARSPRYIETIPKQGYRLIAPVERPSPPAPEPGEPEVGRSTADLAASETPAGAPAPTERPWLRPLLVTLGGLPLILGLFWIGTGNLSSSVDTASSPRVVEETGPTAPKPREGRGSAAGPDRSAPSLAVLPMSTFGPEYQDDYFAEGLTEMLIAELAFGPAYPGEALQVSPSLAIRGDEPWDLDRARRELNVNAVLEGTLLRSGDRLWISMQLVALPDGELLWGRTFERLVGDPLATQKVLSREIAEAVRGRLPHPEQDL